MLLPHVTLEILKSLISLPSTSPLKIWKALKECHVVMSPSVPANAGIAMAHTMATASSAASSFLITFFIMICESLLSSFSDSYFQGLLPAQNQFCRRVRKDAGF